MINYLLLLKNKNILKKYGNRKSIKLKFFFLRLFLITRKGKRKSKIHNNNKIIIIIILTCYFKLVSLI